MLSNTSVNQPEHEASQPTASTSHDNHRYAEAPLIVTLGRSRRISDTPGNPWRNVELVQTHVHPGIQSRSAAARNEPESQGEADDVDQHADPFSALLIAVHLKQSPFPAIFLYHGDHADPSAKDDVESTAQKTPQSWLDRIHLDIPSKVVEFRVTPCRGQSDFKEAAACIRSELEKIVDRNLSKYTSIVFLTHGYGSVIVQQILNLDNCGEFNRSVAAVFTFASPIGMTGGLGGVPENGSELVENWTKNELSKIVKGFVFMPPDRSNPNFRAFLHDNVIVHKQYWERSFSSETSKITPVKDLSSIAEFHEHQKQHLQNMSQALKKVFADHQVFLAIRSSNTETIHKFLRENHSIKAISPLGHNALHLAIKEKKKDDFDVLVYSSLSRRFVR